MTIISLNKQATLGQRLAFLRKSSKTTQKFIYESTGISQSNLSKYERDMIQPTADTLMVLCKFYQVSSDWLLFGVESKKNEVISDPELQRMYVLLGKMMQGDPETRCWAKKQFEYSFKPFLEEEEKKQQHSAGLHSDAG